MAEWIISDRDIESTERLLLTNSAHFPDDARTVIRCWHSTDVAACPGSGKTTVLLAKLKLLADRMPFENGAGICVLSHTNVAVDEIKKRLACHADKLLGYPNYIGTIQSFIDNFVTIPYIKVQSKVQISFVDDAEYARILYRVISNQSYPSPYYNLKAFIHMRYERGTFPYANEFGYFQNVTIRKDGIYHRNERLAGINSNSYKQYTLAREELLKNYGVLRFKDAYSYAKKAVESLSDDYTRLFAYRFQYVFIDEYQDCDLNQRQAIDTLFDPQKCTVMKIGDPDQAIYNSTENEAPDWLPMEGFLKIQFSSRYSQEIADVIYCLKKDNSRIVSSVGNTAIKPIILLFDIEKIDRVLFGFISALEKHHLYDNKGVYKVIGAVRKEESSGLKIGSYWSDFDGLVKTNSDYNYWLSIDEICKELASGKLYLAERAVRKLVLKVFHYLNVKHQDTGKEFTMVSLKKVLDEEYCDIYPPKVYELSRCEHYERETVDLAFRRLVKNLLEIINPQLSNFFASLPEHFLEEPINGDGHNDRIEENVFIDPIRGRRIVFDTIHGVKGETHDATLYLETDRQGASDLNRILPYYGAGRAGKSKLFDYSRKLAYVGFSRPRKLLCVAMQSKTYERSKGVFDKDWEIIDLRN